MSDDCYRWLKETNLPPEKNTNCGEIIRAKKVNVKFGTFTLSVFQMPDGNYNLSQTEVAETVGQTERSFRRFLGSNSPEALPYKGLKTVEIKSPKGTGKPANGIPIPLAAAYWTKESISGNEVASRLLGAAVAENIESRADKAFGFSRCLLLMPFCRAFLLY